MTMTTDKKAKGAPVVVNDNARSEGCDGTQAEDTLFVAMVTAPKYRRHGNGVVSRLEAAIG